MVSTRSRPWAADYHLAGIELPEHVSTRSRPWAAESAGLGRAT
ncbi:hypothetical protein HMPREF9371_1643 [Neisseria shayeganii 871]|uniref:Uncharacterized protein n=1 Tax=Neisseria shayeganii 871 TaxID=1032488 RepID=G4CJ54_9NEIS|nr:hypothetical protein HMPREF9371_1643 [Neisseria shayeganii 871]